MNVQDTLERFYHHQIDIANDGQAPAPLTDVEYHKEILVDCEDWDEDFALLMAQKIANSCYLYARKNNLYKIIMGAGKINIWRSDNLLSTIHLDGDIIATEIIVMGIQARYHKAIWL